MFKEFNKTEFDKIISEGYTKRYAIIKIGFKSLASAMIYQKHLGDEGFWNKCEKAAAYLDELNYISLPLSVNESNMLAEIGIVLREEGYPIRHRFVKNEVTGETYLIRYVCPKGSSQKDFTENKFKKPTPLYSLLE